MSEFLNAQFGALSTVLGMVVAIGIIMSPFVIMVFAPGFEHESDRYLLSVELLKITFPYLAFISLTALLASVLNVFGKFAIPAFYACFIEYIDNHGCNIFEPTPFCAHL